MDLIVKRASGTRMGVVTPNVGIVQIGGSVCLTIAVASRVHSGVNTWHSFLDLLLVSRLRMCCSGVGFVSALLDLAVAGLSGGWHKYGLQVRKKQGGLLQYLGIAHVYLNGAELYTYAFLLSEAKLILKM
jgi:hypothetical protein